MAVGLAALLDACRSRPLLAPALVLAGLALWNVGLIRLFRNRVVVEAPALVLSLGIAEAFYKDGGQLNYGEALNGYRTFLTYYPNHEEAARAQYMVGMSLFQQALSPDRDQSLTQQAIQEFDKVSAAYPTSPYVEQSREKIVECNDRLAEHERFVGRFYQKRRKYNAAIDRYRVILDRYPQYQRTGQVLLDIGTCLLAVGNRPEAEEFFGRLFQDDPKGDLSARAKALLSDYDRSQQREARKERKG